MMDDDYEFTEEEIRQQLRLLGYSNVPEYRLKQFKEGTDIVTCLWDLL